MEPAAPHSELKEIIERLQYAAASVVQYLSDLKEDVEDQSQYIIWADSVLYDLAELIEQAYNIQTGLPYDNYFQERPKKER